MRSLVISHAYAAPDNRVKWEYLGRSGEATVELHLPHRWPSWEHEYHPETESAPGYQVKVAHAFRTGHEDQYFFAPNFLRGMSRGHFDVLHVEQVSWAPSLTQALMERNLFARRMKTCFFTWINYEYQLRFPWSALETYNFRHSHGAIGGNCDVVDLLRKHGFRGKTTVIPQLGVDTDYYSPGSGEEIRKRLQIQGPVIGFVGRLVEEKGVLLLLEAVKSLKTDCTLLFLGSGPLASSLGSMDTKIRSIHISAVPHDEVRDYLRAMDMLVLPSFSTPTWKEQFGHVLIEAMACEVPVIGSSSAAIPEVIEDAGLIFPEKSVSGLMEALRILLNSTPERKRLGKAGRERVLNKYTHEEIAHQTVDFWKTL